MIHYTSGDATEPVVKTGKRVILHITNDMGAWGRGFVLALSAKWPEPEAAYRAQKFPNSGVAGTIQVVPVSNDIDVVNMCAQRMWGQHRVRYSLLTQCLYQVRKHYGEDESALSFHLPRIGCGLGGGEWEDVAYFLDCELGFHEIYVYDL